MTLHSVMLRSSSSGFQVQLRSKMACAILYDVVFLLLQINCCWRTSRLLARRAAVGDHHKDDFVAGDQDDEHGELLLEIMTTSTAS
jgi:hypothetical protein